MALEPDLEQKAAYVLAMGGTAEKQQDFETAVRFYREALAMETLRNGVWYFIHNNLGYSLNMLGQFGEGERFCRVAIKINSSRPNGHKNLGIALAGQGDHREAAKCYVTATKANSGDARSLGLLRDLLQRRPELEYEFGPELVRSEEAAKFAALATQWARNGKILKVLLGCNNPDLDEMFSDMFRCIAGGAVETLSTTHWHDFIDRACAGGFDLCFFIPNNLRRDERDSPSVHPWEFAVRAIRRIKGNSSTAIIVSGGYDEVTEYGQACSDAGADTVIELPFSFDLLADASRRVLADPERSHR